MISYFIKDQPFLQKCQRKGEEKAENNSSLLHYSIEFPKEFQISKVWVYQPKINISWCKQHTSSFKDYTDRFISN